MEIKDKACRMLKKTHDLAKEEIDWIRASGNVMVNGIANDGHGLFVQKFREFIHYGKNKVFEPVKTLMTLAEEMKLSEEDYQSILNRSHPDYSNARKSLASLIKRGRKSRRTREYPDRTSLFGYSKWSSGKNYDKIYPDMSEIVPDYVRMMIDAAREGVMSAMNKMRSSELNELERKLPELGENLGKMINSIGCPKTR